MKNIINKVLGLSFAICCMVNNANGANAMDNQNQDFKIENGVLTILNKSIKTINIPETVTELPQSCFSDCSSLVSLIIPNSVTSIGAFCFKGCSKLNSVNIPDGVTELPQGCFSGCSSLVSLIIPNSA